ncbi:MAG: EamA family transporter RarD [Gammaproteobacteria bacterium]|nr:EamA family transporter RarD [Gammaproteobacteria bacterium]
MITAKDQHSETRDGVIAAVIAYTLWGLFPVYFKWTGQVSPAEMVAHRVVWAVPFGAIIIIARKQLGDVRDALAHLRTIVYLVLGAILIAANWLLYVWAVQNGQIFQASLGYYINPLMYVLVGVVVYHDHLGRLQKVAVALALTAVLVLTFLGGTLPWISLVLAASFTGYGVIRKHLAVAAMPGLFVETLVLFLPAVAYLVYGVSAGTAAITTASPGLVALLILAGPVTVLPLLMFAIAARRLTLSTIGFLQFIGPTLQFLMGLIYGEQLTIYYFVCFVLIWVAAFLYAWDLWSRGRTVGKAQLTRPG